MFERVIRDSIAAGEQGIQNATPNEEGISICNLCGEPRQRWIDMGVLYGGVSLLPVICRCEKEKREQEREMARREQIERYRNAVFGARSLKKGYTFASDDSPDTKASQAVRRFCEEFETHRKQGDGLMLYSKENGSGKTFLACCVANELISKGYRVKVSDLSSIRDEMLQGGDRNGYLRVLERHDLIVLDDYGTESSNELTREAEYRVIDSLIEHGVSLVITANYTPSEMSACRDLNRKRIFDRLLGVCVPIRVTAPEGRSRRLVKGMARGLRMMDEGGRGEK